jgi:TRAP-type C4-dicarboxylate transport system substrate-binding protein
VVYDFGYDRVTNTHYFLRLGVVPLVVMMNKAKFESLPKVAQDAIRSHGLQWMADLYAKEIAAYDQELVKRMKDDPKRKVVVPTKPDEQAIQAALEPVVAAWIKKSPRNAELYKAVTAELETIRGGK